MEEEEEEEEEEKLTSPNTRLVCRLPRANFQVDILSLSLSLSLSKIKNKIITMQNIAK